MMCPSIHQADLSSRKSSDLLTGRRFIHEVSISQLHLIGTNTKETALLLLCGAHIDREWFILEVAQEASKGREAKGRLSVEVHEAKDNKLQLYNGSTRAARSLLIIWRLHAKISSFPTHLIIAASS